MSGATGRSGCSGTQGDDHVPLVPVLATLRVIEAWCGHSTNGIGRSCGVRRFGVSGSTRVVRQCCALRRRVRVNP